MDKQFISKVQINERIEKLIDWVNQNPFHFMTSPVKAESLEYVKLLEECETNQLNEIVNCVPTQIYQQIGKLI